MLKVWARVPVGQVIPAIRGSTGQGGEESPASTTSRWAAALRELPSGVFRNCVFGEANYEAAWPVVFLILLPRRTRAWEWIAARGAQRVVEAREPINAGPPVSHHAMGVPERSARGGGMQEGGTRG